MRAHHQVFLFPTALIRVSYTQFFFFLMYTYVTSDNIPKILIADHAVYFTKCMYQLHSCGECIRISVFRHLIWTLCGCLHVCL